MKHKGERGSVSGLLIANLTLILLSLVLGSVMIWALVSYNDQRQNVDAKIQKAVAEAKKQQYDSDAKTFAEREKQPYKQFVGPSELGRVTFDYPKTWSAYVGSDGGQGTSYEAYLHSGVVPPTISRQPYALRVSIDSRSYDQTLQQYQSSVQSGDLKSMAVTVNGFSGNRLDGKFPGGFEGSMVIFKVRDKSLRLYTETPVFRSDFDNIALKTLKFNP